MVEQNIEILSKIVDNEVVECVRAYIAENEKKCAKWARYILTGHFLRVMFKSRIARLSALTLCLEPALAEYKKRGISEDIYYDTMSDIAVWVKDCRDTFGEIGLGELNWLRLHVNLEIFKLGRLQYQLTRYRFSKPYNDGDISSEYNGKCVALHIPRGGRLDIAECRRSFALARDFLAKYYPDYPNNYATCSSWLLYPDNNKFMKSGSNILAFQQLFTLVDSHYDGVQPIRWMYGKMMRKKVLNKGFKQNGVYGGIENLECKTDLQRAAMDYMLSGGRLGYGEGVCRLDKWAEK